MLVKILEGGIVQETEVGFLFHFLIIYFRSLVLPLPYYFSPQSTTASAWPISCKHRCGEKVKANDFHSFSFCGCRPLNAKDQRTIAMALVLRTKQWETELSRL